MFVRQFTEDGDSFAGPAEAIEGERVGDGAVHIGGSGFVSFFGQALRFLGVRFNQKSEPRIVCRQSDFAGRTLMQLLCHLQEGPQIVVGAVNSGEGIECFPPHGRILDHALPEMLGFAGQIPFHGQTRQCGDAVGIIGCAPFGRTPERVELGAGGRLFRLPGSVGLISEAEIFVLSPRAAAGPALQARPILHLRESFGDGDGGGRSGFGFRRHFLRPFQDFAGKTVADHPVHEQGEVALVALGDGFDFLKDGGEFFLVQFPVKIETEQVIGKSDLLRHLQLLCESVGTGEIVMGDGIAQQGAQSTGVESWHFAQTFERGACLGGTFQIWGKDAEDGEIKLIRLVSRFPLEGSGEVLLDRFLIALGAGEPAGHDMVGGFVAVARRDVIQSVASRIELSETKRGGGEVQLRVQIVRKGTRDLGTPGHGFGPVLFLGGIRQNLKSRERGGPQLEHLLRGLGCAGEVVFLEQGGGVFEQTPFAPAVVSARGVGQGKVTENETNQGRDDEKRVPFGEEAASRWRERFHPPFPPDPFYLSWHGRSLSARVCACATLARPDQTGLELGGGAPFRSAHDGDILDLILHALAQTPSPNVTGQDDLERGS